MAKVSIYWKHFSKVNSRTAICNHCGKVLKTSGNTTNLKCHMKSLHGNLLNATPTNKIEIRLPEVFGKFNKIDADDEKPSLPSSARSSTNSFAKKCVPPISQKSICEEPKTTNDSEKISQVIVYMICQDMQPIRVVERKGFLKVINTLAPLYKVPSTSTFKRLINEKFNVMKDILKQKIVNKKCTITIDDWTDDQNCNYISASVHFYEMNDKIYNGSLGIIQLEEKHSSQYLALNLAKMCTEWAIDKENITAVVSGNTHNVVHAVTLAFGQKKHIPCFAHKLNFVAQKTLEQLSVVDGLIYQVKKIAEWFNHSVVASDELRKTADKNLTQSVPTMWNSTFNMLQSFLELRPQVNIILHNHPSAPCMMTESQIEDIAEVVELLQPLDMACNEICREKYLTSSLSIPIAFILQEKLGKIFPKKDISRRLKEQIHSEVREEFANIESNILLSVATILDPRFKTIYFRNSAHLSQALEFIDDILKTQQQLNISVSTSSSNSNKDKFVSLFSEHNNKIEMKWRRINTATMSSTVPKHHSELSLYIHAPVEKIQQNPLLFWNQMASTYPLLSEVAKVYLTTVATSVPSERLFLKTGQIITEARNKLYGKFASKIIFLNSLSDEFWTE